MKRFLAFSVLAVFLSAAVYADVSLPRIFSDHMVLQREMPVPVWGTADPGETVTVKMGAAQATVKTDAQGKWMVKLPAMKANATGQELTVSGKNALTMKNILVGDVWICGGQSNMEWGLGGCNAPEDIANANFSTIRRIKIDHRNLAKPSTEVPGRWEACTSASAPGFTAVGFYFARRIQKETGLPIGLIDDNWGRTRIEPWIPPVGFELEPTLTRTLGEMKKWEEDYRQNVGKTLDAMEKWIPAARQALATGADVPPGPQMPENPLAAVHNPISLYNGMIHPIIPFAIKGAIWYQGESNGDESDSYYYKMRALIGGWHRLWNQGDFPFYHVQLANWLQSNDNPAGGDGWAKVRMAQLKSLQIPKTGMAVIIDIGEAGDIHPKNNFDVGERPALWALAKDYGKTDLVYSGPLYKSMKIEGNKIRISFDSVGGGLIVGKKEGRNPTVEDKGAKLKRFAIAGEDKNWVWADAVIEGEAVVVSSPAVPNPVAVRYAFAMNPEGCNLYNREGLPASPFRTDDW